MPVSPPLFHQETEYSCGPACLRMILAHLGESKKELYLRELCDCTTEGTRERQLVTAARKLGFGRSRNYSRGLDLKDLVEFVEQAIYPIVFLRTCLEPATPQQKHAVVVVEVSEEKVVVNDPWRGEHIYSSQDFLFEWSSANRVTIVVER